MPTYEYRCPRGHEFEEFQKISDEPTAVCPECGESAERLLSAGAGLIFKGSGFYITDYRDEGYKKAAKAETKKGGSGGGESTDAAGGASGSGSGAKKDSGPASSGGGTSASGADD